MFSELKRRSQLREAKKEKEKSKKKKSTNTTTHATSSSASRKRRNNTTVAETPAGPGDDVDDVSFLTIGSELVES